MNSKMRSDDELLKQFLENLISSTLEKLKRQTGKDLSFPVLILSKVCYQEEPSVISEMVQNFGKCHVFHCLDRHKIQFKKK